MTLCVGALAGSAYIAVSDLFLSSESGVVGRESHFTKISPLGLRWLLSYSGNASDHLGVLTRLKINPTDELSLAEVTEAVWEAYRAERSARIRRYLTKFGILSEESFTQNGRQWLGPERFLEVANVIESLWEYECLVGGFDKDDGYIFTVDERGPKRREIPGFAAIGIGAEAALTVLNRTYHNWSNPPVVAAALLEAKFVAEVSPHIGRETTLWAVSPNGRGHFVKSEHIDELRDTWEIKSAEFIAQTATEIHAAWKKDPWDYMNEGRLGDGLTPDEIGEVGEVLEGPGPVG
ncbi:MAG: hypothetical protein WB609_04590 [Candidatus Cybelea sp.]